MRNAVGRVIVLTVMTALVASPSFGATDPPSVATFPRYSGIVSYRYWVAHPEQAPPEIAQRLETFLDARSSVSRSALQSASVPEPANVFTTDSFGLPQNEESVAVCHSNPQIVLSGTNDYRGLLFDSNTTGWYFSRNGGASVTNEGLLPPVEGAGQAIPSSGDPVDVTGPHCRLFAADLNVDPSGPPGDTASAIGVYRSSPNRLAGCNTQSDLTNAHCWRVAKAVDVAAPGHFLDKDWMDVGRSGSNWYVWIVYSDTSDVRNGVEHASSIKGVRCTIDLSHCTAPITISGNQDIAELAYVTIGPDGRVYVTWSQYLGKSFNAPTEAGWMAVAQPGSTHFSAPVQLVPPTRAVLQTGGFLHANDFRINTMFKNTVAMVNGKPRVFVSYDLCAVPGHICEEPQVHVLYTDRFGNDITDRIVSRSGDNYFSEIDADPDTGAIVDAYYTNRFDPIFHNRQDVEMVTLDDQARVERRRRITRVSNETEADPFLGGFFIGDYFQVAADHGTAYVAYNANERQVRFLGRGVPVPQQDNYLRKVSE